MKHTDILIKIRQIIRSVNLESKRIEKEYGISIPQLLCLNHLREVENFQATHKEIKDTLQLNASTVTGIISRLEKKGLVARMPRQSDDKRVSMILLTAKGAKLVDGIPSPLHQQLSEKLQKISPKQLAELEASFDTILGFLNIQSLEASPILTAATHIQQKETP